MFGFRKWKRYRIHRQPWPTQQWNPVIKVSFPSFFQLHDPYLERAKTAVQIMNEERRFEGCGGLTMSDEIRLTILTQASLLLLGDTADYYHTVRSILVYPDTYTAPVRQREHNGYVVSEGFESRLGESWSFGNIVLAWDSVRRQARSFGNGINVTLHEFAHHLDQEFGVSDQVNGIEVDEIPSWILSIRTAYHRFLESVHRGRPRLMDPYGAENPAEFFAVASENFIERPYKLHKAFPRLYEALQFFYQFDARRIFS